MASTSGDLSNVGEEDQEIHYKQPRLEEELPRSATARQVSVTETCGPLNLASVDTMQGMREGRWANFTPRYFYYPL